VELFERGQRFEADNDPTRTGSKCLPCARDGRDAGIDPHVRTDLRDRGHECILKSPALDRVEIGDVQILEAESLDVKASESDCVAADINAESRGDREILGSSSSMCVNGARAKEIDDADDGEGFQWKMKLP